MNLFWHRTKIRWSRELGILGATVFTWVGGEYLRVRKKPKTGVEHEAQKVLNRIDRLARDRIFVPVLAERSDRVSDVVAYVALPIASMAALIGTDHLWRRNLLKDAINVGRAVTVTGAVNQVVKWLVPRERPWMQSEKLEGHDVNGSFFSLHTSTAVALAAAVGTVLTTRNVHRAAAYPLFTLAGFIGYLRIAADMHFLTDVLAGAGFGAVLGAALAR